MIAYADLSPWALFFSVVLALIIVTVMVRVGNYFSEERVVRRELLRTAPQIRSLCKDVEGFEWHLPFLRKSLSFKEPIDDFFEGSFAGAYNQAHRAQRIAAEIAQEEQVFAATRARLDRERLRWRDLTARYAKCGESTSSEKSGAYRIPSTPKRRVILIDEKTDKKFEKLINEVDELLERVEPKALAADS